MDINKLISIQQGQIQRTGQDVSPEKVPAPPSTTPPGGPADSPDSIQVSEAVINAGFFKMHGVQRPASINDYMPVGLLPGAGLVPKSASNLAAGLVNAAADPALANKTLNLPVSNSGMEFVVAKMHEVQSEINQYRIEKGYPSIDKVSAEQFDDLQDKAAELYASKVGQAVQMVDQFRQAHGAEVGQAAEQLAQRGVRVEFDTRGVKSVDRELALFGVTVPQPLRDPLVVKS